MKYPCRIPSYMLTHFDLLCNFHFLEEILPHCIILSYAIYIFVQKSCISPLCCLMPHPLSCRNHVPVHYVVFCHIHFHAEIIYQSIILSFATSTFRQKLCISPLCCLMLHLFSCTKVALFHYVVPLCSIMLCMPHPLLCRNLVAVCYIVSCYINFLHVSDTYTNP